MAVDYPLTPGYDPTSDTEITSAELLQMVSLATPKGGFGFVIIGSAAPDTALNPWMVRCLWIDNSDANDVVVRQYDTVGGGWEPIGLADGSVTNDKIAAQTIKGTEKFALDGGTAYQVYRINAGGTAWEVVDPSDVFAVGSFALDKLVTGADGQFLVVSGSAAAWTTLGASHVNDALGSGGLTISSIAAGSPLYVLRTQADGSAPEWVATTSIVTLGSVQSALAFNRLGFEYIQLIGSNMVPVVNATGTGWTGVSKSTLAGTPQLTVGTLISTDLILTGSGGGGVSPYSIAHTLGVLPVIVTARLKCIANDASHGWNTGDYLDVKDCVCSVATGNFASFITGPVVPYITITTTSGLVNIYLNKAPHAGIQHVWIPKNQQGAMGSVSYVDLPAARRVDFEIHINVFSIA